MNLRAACLCLFAALALAAPALAKERRLALIIANETYSPAIGRLSKTHEDADNVGKALTAVGFTVDPVLDANSEQMDAAFTRFEKAINDAASSGDDVVAFFYASMHGAAAEVEGRDRNFLLPVGEEITTTGQLIRKAYRVDQLIQALGSSKAKAVFIVSDACRNNMAASFNKGGDKGFTAEPAGPGVLVAYATAPGSTTPDDGLFGRTLAAQLRVAGRKASYAMLETVESVAKQRGWDNQPFLQSGGLPETLCFNGCAAPPAADLQRQNAELKTLADSLTAKLQTVQFATQGFTRMSPFLRRLDRDFFAKVAPKAKPELIDVFVSRKDILARSGIDTPQRITHFLAQLAHESNDFTMLEERLTYTTDRLMQQWARQFPTREVAETYAGKAPAIANRIYANKMGNGDEASGDGWRYRGRGLIQLTGRANYKALGEKLGIDLITDPDQLTDPELALAVAAASWDSQLNALADLNDIAGITKRITGRSAYPNDTTANAARIADLAKPYADPPPATPGKPL